MKRISWLQMYSPLSNELQRLENMMGWQDNVPNNACQTIRPFDLVICLLTKGDKVGFLSIVAILLFFVISTMVKNPYVYNYLIYRSVMLNFVWAQTVVNRVFDMMNYDYTQITFGISSIGDHMCCWKKFYSFSFVMSSHLLLSTQNPTQCMVYGNVCCVTSMV